MKVVNDSYIENPVANFCHPFSLKFDVNSNVHSLKNLMPSNDCATLFVQVFALNLLCTSLFLVIQKTVCLGIFHKYVW